MRRLKLTLASALALLAIAPQAQAAFGLNDMQVTFTGPDGETAMQAGSHPFAITTTFNVNAVEDGGKVYVAGALRDLEVNLPAGFAGKPTATPRCSNLDFLTKLNGSTEPPECADSTAVGVVKVAFAGGTPQEVEEAPDSAEPTAAYNLEPPPGVAAKIGFWASEVPIAVLLTVNPDPPHSVVATLRNTSQVLEVLYSSFTIWGNPADSAHDKERGKCLRTNGICPANVPVEPFVTLPRSCAGPLETIFKATPWWEGDPLAPIVPGTPFEGTAVSPPGTTGCSKLGFSPKVKAQPTSLAASSPSGLEVDLSVKDEGLTNPKGIANADISRVEVTLPEGMTANPALASGLEVCTEAQLDRETAFSQPGDGCPNASKIGSLEVETPLLDKTVSGSLHIAESFKNPFGSLLALYLVIKDAELGISITQPLKVEPNAETGQLTTIAEDLPQLPYSSLRLRLREGARSPLVTPPSCDGDKAEPGVQPHQVIAKLTPSSGGPDVFSTSEFELIAGPGGGPCPQGATPPFEPGFSGGTLNNAAGRYSPFLLRLTRRDGDQDLVRFDATLPPGALAKLAGVSYCTEADIARIETRTGREELANPTCPANSKIGTVQAGAGVGSQLLYVPGSVYLAGPFAGAPLSIVGVVPAVAGPFDVGVIATRQALTVDPITGVAKADGSKSEPIPHILAGIPLKVRDIQVSVDRPNFTLNPTNCDPLSFGASLWGGGGDPFLLDDDSPVSRNARFQAADCASLGFKPKLALNLKGGIKRGQFPALTTTYTPRPGDANLKGLSLRLPRSAFLEQGHFRTICTRVQFAADACPPGAVYGRVKAFTPLIDTPLEGPIYLRSSSHDLPDIVFDLKGLVDVEASARVDSVKGGIRVRIDNVPDAPISKVVVTMQGGQKGLIVNSRDLCAKPSRANGEASAQSGKRATLKPLVKAKGCKGKKRAKKRKSRRGA